jgi:penicillin-binding protein 1A
MEGVVQRGTGQKLKVLNRPIAGKTGTTNDEKDGWFIGFTPDLVVGAYFGFDNPSPMGHGETGGNTAAPAVRDFFKVALVDQPPVPFRAPPGIKLVRVNLKTGLPAGSGDKTAIMEAFKPGDQPQAGDSIEPEATGEAGVETSGGFDPLSGGPPVEPGAGPGPVPGPGPGPMVRPGPPGMPGGAFPGAPPSNDRSLTSGTGGLY